MTNLFEASRSQLLNKSKHSVKGKQRFDRRTKSKVANSVRQYNEIDMNKLFKEDVLEFSINITGETDSYQVKLRFEDILDKIRDQLERNNNELNFRCIVRGLLSAFDSEDVYVSCTCLHPTTRIKLLDGTEPTVEELRKRYDSGEKLYVYSTDKNGDFRPGEVEKVWVTKSGVSNFIKVTLDNGEQILTTPDHLFMLRDGSYLPAQELKSGISLMPLYFDSRNGYETVKLNTTSKYHSVYKIVSEFLKKTEIQEAEIRSLTDDSSKFNYRVAIHHKNFNKSDNTPENLQPMTAFEHWNYHANLCGADRNVTDRMREIASLNAKKRNANPTPAMLEQRKQCCEKGRLRNYDEDRKLQQSELMRKTMKDYYENISDEKRADISNKLSKNIKNSWDRGCFNTKKFHDARVREGKRLLNDSENQKKMLYGRSRKVLEYLVAEKIPLTEENYEKYRRKTDPHIKTLFSSFDEAVSYYKLNHKVTSVEYFTDDPVDVYDIKVKDYNNFLVNSSVIVHNCPDWFYRFSYQSTKNDTNSGEPQSIPANITNPNDTLGSACKHVLLVLNNTSWMMKVASVIFNYINYMKERYCKLYADIIYPAIYGKEYDGVVQFNIDDKTTELLDTDKDTIDISNKQAAERGKFKQGNEQGYRFVKGKDKDQITIDDIDPENSEEEITDKQDI